MDKTYDPKKVEDRIYKFWEEKGYFKPEINQKGTFSIILPPPNANAPLHFGHAMYVIEDILIRYHRMKGDMALWLPGADHAGFETQYVFEKKLQSEGKSRFDYDRDTLFNNILDFVEKNRPVMESQLKKLGFSLDWSRKKFTLEPDIIEIVQNTFKKLFRGGFIVRDERLVNFCIKDGTSFSDLEVIYEKRKDKLYFIAYPIKNSKDSIIVATTRPETMLGDIAIAVNPEDKPYKKFADKIAILPLVSREIKIIKDASIDKEFGTGAVKVTPSHDFKDNDLAFKHHLAEVHDLESISIIDINGKMKNAGKYTGMKLKLAREEILKDLKSQGFYKDEKEIVHQVPVCYKCHSAIEPMILIQWFLQMEELAQPALEVIEQGKIKIFPRRFKAVLVDFFRNIRDWNISRQIAWGIRIPIWYEIENDNKFYVWILDKNGKYRQGTVGQLLRRGISFEDIENGLQRLFTISPTQIKWVFEEDKENGKRYLPETDTFDTWFSSAQWPFATLQTTGDFEKFYPTTVLETGYDILRWWVARMIMMGLYVTKKVPFENVILHGLVKDPLGKKMSKSKGNVVNPIEVIEEYGADAVRFALVFGTALGNDQSLSYSKFQNGRNFANKLWNMARFIKFARQTIKTGKKQPVLPKTDEWSKTWYNKIQKLIKEVTAYLDDYKFNFVAERLYEFIWHEFADFYIEGIKVRMTSNSLTELENNFSVVLKLLHPFMPFITEEIYQKLFEGESIMIQAWPK